MAENSGPEATAVFAMGCFWCGEEALEPVPGVVSVVSGYSGGFVDNPTYREVVSGSTGHLEVIQVKFDSTKVTFAGLLEYFWGNVDPLDARGQFCDKGASYVSAIFCDGPSQCDAAKASKREIEARHPDWSIATSIRPSKPFFPAETYHQDYYIKNPSAYAYYKGRCGRVARLKSVWGEAVYNKTHVYNTFAADAIDPYLWLKILVGVLGGVVGICVILGAAWMMLRARKRSKSNDNLKTKTAVEMQP